MAKFKRDLLFILALGLLPLLLYWPVTVGSQTMLPLDNLYQWAPWQAHAAATNSTIPHNSLISDLILQNYNWRQFIRESLEQRELPLWNPYILAGTPFLAKGQHLAYYPFSLLFLVLPLMKAYGWFTVSQLWLAGVLTYVLGRVWGLRRSSAFLAGLVYQGCGFMLVSAAVFPMIIAAAAWLPLLLACIELIFQHTTNGRGGNTLPFAALGSLALGCQILASHVEITYYTLLVMAFYTVWRFATHLWHSLRQSHSQNSKLETRNLTFPLWVLTFTLVGLMLGAVQFVPLYEVGQSNFRQGSATLAEVRGWGFPARRILTLALPNFFGNPSHHEYQDVFTGQRTPFTTNAYGGLNPQGAYTSDWGIKNYVEGGIYLGIVPLLLAGIGIFTWLTSGGWSLAVSRWLLKLTPNASLLSPHSSALTPKLPIGFLLTLSGLSLAFIFGTPLYGLLYYGLPFINQLHSPFRWVFPFSLCLAGLAGYGLDVVRRGTSADGQEGLLPYGKHSSRITYHASRFTLAAGLFILTGLLLSRFFYVPLEPLLDRVFRGLALADTAFANAAAFYSYTFWQVLWLGGVLVAAGVLLGRLAVSREPLAAKGRLSLLTAHWPLLTLFLLVGVDLAQATGGFNAAADPTLLTIKPELAHWLETQPGLWRITTFNPHGDKPLNANAGWLYHLQDVRGYDSIIARQYTEYMGAIEAQNELPFNRIQPIANWESLNSPLLDILGVKYILTAETVELPKLQLVWEGEGVRVYENLAVTPRAITLPRTATRISSDPLAELASHDPRQFVIIHQADWPERRVITPQAAAFQAAIISDYRSIQVTAEAAVDEPSWLVLHDSYEPGWRAWARPQGSPDSAEQEVTVYLVNGNFRGVMVEPGAWEVRFRYSPLSFRLGGLISFIGGIILAFAGLVWGWRRLVNPQAELTNTRSIAKNSIAPTVLNLFNRGIDFVFAAFYLRYLGPAEAGGYATAITIAGLFEIIANFGLNTLLIREVSQDKGQASRYLLNTTVLRVGTGIVAALPILLYILSRQWGGNPLSSDVQLAVWLIMVGMIFSGMGQGLAGLFYAYEQAEFPAAITTITTILKVGLGVMALLFGFGFVGLAGVSILVNIITLGILLFFGLRRFQLPGPWRIDLPLQRQMLYLSYPLMINHLFAVIFFQVDVLVLQQLKGDAVVGWYNSAYKYINALNVIPSFFTFALFPVISRQVKSSVEDARRSFQMAIKIMALISLPLAVLITLTAPVLIGLLGGAAFLPHGSIALQIVVWSIPIGWLNSVTNYVLIALGQERLQTRAFLIGVGFNLLGNLLLIPRYSYAAAGVITILSEIVLLAIFNYYLVQRMPGVGWFRLLARPLLVTLLMGMAGFLGAQLHLWAGVILALAVYPLGLWGLRVFGEEERKIAAAILPAKVAAIVGREKRNR